jgi:hypothetical protein
MRTIFLNSQLPTYTPFHGNSVIIMHISLVINMVFSVASSSCIISAFHWKVALG